MSTHMLLFQNSLSLVVLAKPLIMRPLPTEIIFSHHCQDLLWMKLWCSCLPSQLASSHRADSSINWDQIFFSPLSSEWRALVLTVVGVIIWVTCTCSLLCPLWLWLRSMVMKVPLPSYERLLLDPAQFYEFASSHKRQFLKYGHLVPHDTPPL